MIISNNLYIVRILFKVSKGRIPLEIMFHASKGGVQTLIYTYLFGSIVNNIQENKQYQEIFLLIAIVAAITSLALIFQSWFLNIYLPYSNLKIQKSCLTEIYLHSTEVNIRKYEDPNFYDSYIKALDEASSRCISLSGLIGEFFGTLFTVCYLLYIVITTEYVLVFFAIVLTIASFFLGKRRNKVNFELNMESVPHNRGMQYLNRISYMHAYAIDMRLTNIFKVLKRDYENNAENLYQVNRSKRKSITVIDFILSILSEGLIYVGVLVYITYQIVINKTLQIGDYLIIVNAVSSMSWRVIWLINSLLRFDDSSRYISNLISFMNIQSEYKDEAGKKILEGPIKSIEFKDVSFSYEKGVPILKNFNITLREGEKVAIVGKNGAGKSTFVKLLLGLYRPDSGIILINGIPIDEYNLHSYRNGISSIFQDFMIYAISVGQNIALNDINDPEAERIWEVANDVGLLQTIYSLPHKQDTIVTREFADDGYVPSGGESQKLAIARLLYKCDNKILIMDEPTSALDPISEKQINDLVMGSASDKLTIVISHRLSSVVNADKIFYFDDKNIKEQGTHQELMKLNRDYALMFRTQAEKYKSSNIVY